MNGNTIPAAALTTQTSPANESVTELFVAMNTPNYSTGLAPSPFCNAPSAPSIPFAVTCYALATATLTMLVACAPFIG